MSFITFLEKIRKEPESSRRSIAIGCAFGVTLVIFIAWLVYFTHEIRIAMTVSRNEAKIETPSPFSTIGAEFKSFWTTVRNGAQAIGGGK